MYMHHSHNNISLVKGWIEENSTTPTKYKATKRSDRARHDPWHDMATTQPTSPQIDHPKKEKNLS